VKSKSIDSERLTITGTTAPDSHVTSKGDVIILVTHVYGPDGDNLVGISDVKFDGYPAITVKVKVDDAESLVHLSPFHGDRRKVCNMEIEVGTRCELFCPISGKPLDRVNDEEGAGGSHLYALYLTPKLSAGEMVAISDVWGDYNSKIIDGFELISYFAAQEDELNAE